MKRSTAAEATPPVAATALDVTEICALISPCLKASGPETDVQPDTELLLTGVLDSLTVVKIVAELERTIGVDLPPTFVAAKNFRTPQTLHDALAASTRSR